MRFLVTGGLGYIGQIVVSALKKNGHDVLVVDKNLFSQEVPFTYVKQDLQDFLDKTSDLDFDTVVHLSSIVGEAACLNNPSESLRSNYELTKRLADLCNKEKVRLVYASTCSVYGNQTGILTEESKTMPVDFYGQTKLLGEKEVLKSARNVALRFGTIYGWAPRVRFDLVINKFVGRAMNKLPLEVFGGTQNRPFTHVEDVARAVVFFAEDPQYTGTYNVAHENYSLNDAAERIGALLSAKVNVTNSVEDNRNYQVSSKKLLSLGFSFKRTFDEAIKELSKNISEKKIDFTNKIYYNHSI
jgi:nucleoside-diphosphate-sugar epimerase